MEIFHTFEHLAELPAPIHLAIGVFDGVHLGHQAVIRKALAGARKQAGTAVVVTFDPHPASVLRPSQSPALLTSTRHKLRILSTFGVEHVLVVRFDAAFAMMAPSAFIELLSQSCHPMGAICVGETWEFGKARAGNLALIQEMGRRLNFEVHGVKNLLLEEQLVSSTLIRNAVRAGDLGLAHRLLGRPFSMFGTVIHGNQLARKMGYATANFRPESEQLPPHGVYAARVSVHGSMQNAVVNVGIRPTLACENGEALIEAHLFDYDGDIYGHELEVHFLHFIRREMKFPSLKMLADQMRNDAGDAKSLLARR